jgi:glycosyltransferase involved in cell wall biosynthesis
MRILVCHNMYNTKFPSGENNMVVQQIKDLQNLNHEVISFLPGSDQLTEGGFLKKLLGVSGVFFNVEAYFFFRKLTKLQQIDVVHFHNLFPLIGPFAIRFFSKRNVPVVLTLHNYRTGCIKGTHFKDNRLCQKCNVNSINTASFIEKCYRDSFIQSLLYEISRKFLVFNYRYVTSFVTLTEFMKSYLKNSIQLSSNQMVEVIYNSSSPSVEATRIVHSNINQLVFIGRLSEEKGIRNLLSAWENCHLDKTKWKLIVAGSGPLQELLDFKKEGIEFKGKISGSAARDLIGQSRLVVIPSLWFEGFPLVLSEAASIGKGVIVSNVGGLGSLELGHWVIKTDPTSDGLRDTLNGLDEIDYLSLEKSARNWYQSAGSQNVLTDELVDLYRATIRGSI